MMKTGHCEFRALARAGLVGALLLATNVASGCRPASLTVDIVWPPPPDTPRVRYLRPIRASSDVEQRGTFESFIDVLLGGQQQIYVIKKPYGVAVDPSGRLLVADTGWGRVLVFDLPQNQFSFMGDGPMGQLSKPAGIAIDQDGTIYVSDLVLHRVYVFGDDLEFKRALGKQGRFAQPVGVAVDRERRRVYVVDAKKHEVVVFDTEGRELQTIGRRGSGEGEFNYPSNVAVSPSGDVYVADTFNFRIQRFDSNGDFLGQWGRLGDQPGMFARPKGVAVDREGHVYVVDAAFHNVQMFTPDGRLLMFFGGIGRGLGQLYLPAGIHVTSDGYIYVADQLNRRVDVLYLLGGAATGGPVVPPAP